MKWGGFNRKGEERMRKVLNRFRNHRGLFLLFSIATVGLLLAENIKWRPGGR
jgi:hypothetical protein